MEIKIDSLDNIKEAAKQFVAAIDQNTVFGTFPATNASFVLPFICFLIVTVYGYRTHIRRSI